MIELLIENKANNKIYEISEMVTSISFTDKLNNGCNKLEFTYLCSDQTFPNGSVVRYRYNNANIFFGYIFNHVITPDGRISVTAYDQLRYFKAKDTIVAKDLRVDELIARGASYFKLKTGKLDNTGYKLPTSVFEDKTWLDMIYDGISATLLGTGRKYAFYDDFGSLALSDIKTMKLPLSIGDESLVYSYDYKQSIDENTYNLIKLSRENEDTGKRDIFISQDSSTFGKYGILQYYEKADKKANSEQLKAKSEALLKLMNTETKSLSISAFGDTRVRAGTGILIDISSLGIKQYLIVESCTHTYKSDNHTMSLELIL